MFTFETNLFGDPELSLQVTGAPAVPGVIIAQSGGSTAVTEGGATDTYTLVLSAQPTADVTIALTPSDQVSADPTTLVFTPENWDVAQTVTVTAVDDAVAEGAHTGTIGHTVASADANYNGLSVDGVTVQIADNDLAGITVTPTSGLVTTERGGTATFSVKLDSQPAADVTIGLSSSDAGEGTVAPTVLTFTPGNWDTPRTVTVTGVDDHAADGDAPYTIVTAAAVSADANYNGLDAADVSVTNIQPPTARSIGIYSNVNWYLDANGNGVWNGTPSDSWHQFGGQAGAIAVAGDWNGDGASEIGIYSNGNWYLDTNGNGIWDGNGIDSWYQFGGQAGAIPVAGDWNGDGKSEIGIYANGNWYLDANGNGVWDGKPTDSWYQFGGQAGAIPVAGDWNGDGKSEIGIYSIVNWYLDVNGNGVWNGTPTDSWYQFGGQAGAIPVAGDWNGDGKSEIGVYVNAIWYLDANGNGVWNNTPTDARYVFGGQAGARPIVGNWQQSGSLAQAAGATTVLEPDTSPPGQSLLAPTVPGATARYAMAGVAATSPDAPAWDQVAIAYSLDSLLSEPTGRTTVIGSDTAGCGWFVDPTPTDDLEFTDLIGPHATAARNDSRAVERVDLLTAVMREMGNALEYEHSDPFGLMYPNLSLGTRRSLDRRPAFSIEGESGMVLSTQLVDTDVLDGLFASFSENGQRPAL